MELQVTGRHCPHRLLHDLRHPHLTSPPSASLPPAAEGRPVVGAQGRRARRLRPLAPSRLAPRLRRRRRGRGPQPARRSPRDRVQPRAAGEAAAAGGDGRAVPEDAHRGARRPPKGEGVERRRVEAAVGAAVRAARGGDPEAAEGARLTSTAHPHTHSPPLTTTPHSRPSPSSTRCPSPSRRAPSSPPPRWRSCYSRRTSGSTSSCASSPTRSQRSRRRASTSRSARRTSRRSRRSSTSPASASRRTRCTSR